MKKLILLLILISLFVPHFANPVYATVTAPTLTEHAEALHDNATGGINNAVMGAHSEANRLWDWVCWLGLAIACDTDPKIQQTSFNSSLLGKSTNAIATLYINRPADLSTFAAYYSQKLGIVKPAYAQGVGFSGLSPLLPLWVAFRNISYAFLIVIMVVIGFMILFRMKIDPRTVVSIQNALPRVIIALILITFSYAIVGLLIDTLYLFIFLAIGILSAAMPGSFPNFIQAYTTYTGGSFGILAGAMAITGLNSVDSIVRMIFGGFGALAGLGAAIGGFIGLATNGISLKSLGWVGLGTVGALALPYLIILLAILISLIRLFITLISAYIQIIVSLIFAPLILMFGAFPNIDAFGTWFRGLIANMSVFAVTSIMLLIGMILVNYDQTPNLWTPPGLSGSIPLTGDKLASGVTGIIGLAFLFIIPNVADAIKEALKAKPVIPVGASTLLSPITQPAGMLFQLAYQAGYIKSAFFGDKREQPGHSILPPTQAPKE